MPYPLIQNTIIICFETGDLVILLSTHWMLQIPILSKNAFYPDEACLMKEKISIIIPHSPHQRRNDPCIQWWYYFPFINIWMGNRKMTKIVGTWICMISVLVLCLAKTSWLTTLSITICALILMIPVCIP